MSAEIAMSNIRRIARQLGFHDCRVARAGIAPHAGAYRDWIRDGCEGDMGWMTRDPERRSDPRLVLTGARSVIVLAINYFQGGGACDAAPSGKPRGVIARYARGDDYHDLVEQKLADLADHLASMGGKQRCYVDTGPVLERDFASEAGIGWNGKSTVQIHPELGSWFFLAVMLTTLDLPADKPAPDRCGKCVRCITACPTGAITRPHHVDARRCISYLTIEHKGPIPIDLRRPMGNRIFGCDDCLAACPWNRFARTSREAAFHARDHLGFMALTDYLRLSDEEFRALFRRSPIKRGKRNRFLRNVCIALGNTGSHHDLPALKHAAQDPDPLIAEHAQWAAEEIERRTGGGRR